MCADCIFCQIVNGKEQAEMIWEDEKHVAFLSIFPNTEAFTVVATKHHYPSYCFDLPDDILTDLTLASKKVGKLLDGKLEDVGRTGMIMEGFGVDHVHTKLFPMHGTAAMKQWEPVQSKMDKFFYQYEGYISSHDCKQADPDKLKRLASKIRN